MPWERVNAPSLPALPEFAHATIAGSHIYVSGMLGLKDDFSGLVPGGIGPETTQALALIEIILAACDAKLADVAMVQAHLPDLSQWSAMNEAYMAVFGERTPARVAVGCGSLLFGASVELQCTAYR